MTSHYWWTTTNKSSKRYKSSSQKQMLSLKKNNQHKRNYLLTSKQQNTVSISSHSTWWTTKMAKRIWNWYFIYQFHQRPFMSLNWYPVCHQNNNDEQKQTKNGHFHAIWRQTIQTWRNMRHVTPLSSQDKNQKVSKWH